MNVKKQNTQKDIDKHVEVFETHLQSLWGDDWEELTAKQICKLLAKTTLGLNGGTLADISSASEVVGFDFHNLVHTPQGDWQVLTMIEFTGEPEVSGMTH